MSEEIKPCPFCGKHPSKEIPKKGEYEYILPNCRCVSSDENGDPWAYSTDWQNAFCWKELEEKDRQIKVLREALKNIKRDLEICDWRCYYSECPGVLDMKDTDVYMYAKEALKEVEK
jgi:hypothetical protein